MNKYVFSVLSSVNLTAKPSTDDIIQNLIPEYLDTIPSKAYRYDDAILHMKKDRQKLEEDIAAYQERIKEYNVSHVELQSAVRTIIEREINQAGYIKGQNDDFVHIYQWVNDYLKQVKADNNMRQRAIQIASSKMSGIGTEAMVNTIKDIIQCETIHGYLDQVKQHEKNLTAKLSSINDKSNTISRTIEEGDYNTEADCCPTYLSLVKRLF
jgi:DNA repair exonuclease SbcCD ATPase subunit